MHCSACRKSTLLLRTFTKLRKATVNVVMSVRPTVRHSALVDKLTPNGWIFIQFHFECISKLCPETSFFNKAEQE